MRRARDAVRVHASRGVVTAEPARYTGAMPTVRTLVLVLACLPAFAAAQWQWIDNNGQRVFSDKAPPPEIPPKNILRQPGVRGTPPAALEAQAAASAAAAAPKAAASAPKISGKDAALEDKRKQAEAAAADKKKKQEEEIASVRAENCKRARQSKATFDAGIRISRVNDKGEREILDDKQRAAELKHLEGIIARDCA